MGVILRTFLASTCLAVAVVGSAYAQTADSSLVLSESHAVTNVAEHVASGRDEPLASSGEAFAQSLIASRGRSRSRGMSAAGKGALIGGGAAAAITGVAASAYGKNEGGRFCGACFVRWSAFAVPVGAGLGALIGFGIDRAHRPVTAVPLLSPSAAGLIVTARF